MIDALQVFVRGFEDGERGRVIREYLDELGFAVTGAFDGESDSLGGLIETDVAYQDELEETDPDAILVELRRRTGFDGLWLQIREFRLAEEGEFGRQGDGQDDGTQIQPLPIEQLEQTKQAAEAGRQVQKKYPWQDADRHDGEFSNLVTDHLLRTCPKEVLDCLLAQVKEHWDEVIDDEQVQTHLESAGNSKPYPIKNCLEMALDGLMWRTVRCLSNDYSVRSEFDILTMTIRQSDLLVLKNPGPNDAGKKETFIGIALELVGNNEGITFFPTVGPHFECSWHRGLGGGSRTKSFEECS